MKQSTNYIKRIFGNLPVVLLVLFVLLAVLRGLSNFVDSKASIMPSTLMHRIRNVSIGLNLYYVDHDRFPSDLSGISSYSSFSSSDSIDPYSPTRKELGYNRVVSATGEYCELYTVRLEAPAVIISGSNGFELTQEFEHLRKTQLGPESRNEALPPNATLVEKIFLYLLHYPF